MKEEDKKNKSIEDEEEDDTEDDDYVPSDEDKGLSFENELASKLRSVKCYSLMNPFLLSDDEGSADEANLDVNDLEITEIKNEEKISTSKQLNDDEKKKRMDELWSDLCSSTSSTNKSIKKTADNSQTSSTSTSLDNSKSSSTNNLIPLSNKIKLTKEYEFAGEKVKVEEEVNRSEIDKLNKKNLSTNSIANPLKRGLNSLVANLGKKQKLSTLNKTKLDWDMFKKDEGIEDDLKNHTKNKNSFVERQAFLQRTDLKQFELEKSVREKTRNTRNLN